MRQLQTKKEINTLAMLFLFTYMASYITRINYGTIVSEMETATGIARSLLSMALTGSFITYGVGQVISGVLGDHVSPKRLVSIGFVVTILMNLLIPVCRNPYQMLAVWCVNGFAQSFMWPPLVKLMATLLSDQDYKKVAVKVNWGGSIGTIALYLISPLIISLAGYKAVFLFSAICGGIMLVIWNLFATDIPLTKREKPEKKAEKPEKGAGSPLFRLFMIGVMVAIMLQGFLRDGITTWMPTCLADTYGLSNEISILSSVVLPIFSIISFQIITRIYRKYLTNPLVCAAAAFGVGALVAVALYFLNGVHVAYSVVFFTLLSGCMHGINLILVCMVPAFFNRYGNVSTASGVLNSCTYIGSAVSAYGIALLSERMGWDITIFMWIAVALVGAALCWGFAGEWGRTFDSRD